MLPARLRFIWPSSFRGEDFLEIDQSETRISSLPPYIILVSGWSISKKIFSSETE
jgi:hypothetical protein